VKNVFAHRNKITYPNVPKFGVKYPYLRRKLHAKFQNLTFGLESTPNKIFKKIDSERASSLSQPPCLAPALGGLFQAIGGAW
jgi:hypothetical protein